MMEFLKRLAEWTANKTDKQIEQFCKALASKIATGFTLAISRNSVIPDERLISKSVFKKKFRPVSPEEKKKFHLNLYLN